MLLAMTRRLYETITATRQGQWSDNPPLISEFQQSVRRIGGHTVGIVGFGNIGRAFAMRIRGFGPAQIIAYDPFVPQSSADLYGVRLVSLEELARTADYISIHSSATNQSYHLFNADLFAQMKPTAILVNCSRGPLIDQKALLTALQEGQIESAAIDVTEIEPIEHDNPLLKVPNLVITPHLAGFSPPFSTNAPTNRPRTSSTSSPASAPTASPIPRSSRPSPSCAPPTPGAGKASRIFPSRWSCRGLRGAVSGEGGLNQSWQTGGRVPLLQTLTVPSAGDMLPVIQCGVEQSGSSLGS